MILSDKQINVLRVDTANSAIVPRIHHEEFSTEWENLSLSGAEKTHHFALGMFLFRFWSVSRRSNELINLSKKLKMNIWRWQWWIIVCNKNDEIYASNFERTKDVKMLKWIKVRQNASAATSVSTPAPSSLISQQEIKNNETRVKIEDKIKEEGEDSGMEKEDSVCNIELTDLKKVRLCFYWFLH